MLFITLDFYVFELQSNLYIADMLSEYFCLTETFLGTKPGNYGQILIEKPLCSGHLYIANTFVGI